MIEIEIKDTINKDRLGIYNIHRNTISLGSHPSDDIMVDQDQINKQHIHFNISKNKLFLELGNDVERIHVNKKICNATKSLKINDEIKINNTMIKILNFSQSQIQTRKELLNQKVSELPEKRPELVEILQELSQ